MKINAVIVAAGSSSRMGQASSKLFIDLNGKSVIKRSLDVFENCDVIEKIILVCRECDIAKMEEESKNITKLKKIAFGGKDRQESVLNGVKYCDDCDFIAIHDGARPLVSINDIKKACKDAELYSATTLAVKVKDTIKLADSKGFVAKTPEREFLYAVQTPQVFLKDLYLKSVELATTQGKSFTDDCQLIENFGKKVYLTEGSYENIKITTPEDVAVALGLCSLGKEDY